MIPILVTAHVTQLRFVIAKDYETALRFLYEEINPQEFCNIKEVTAETEIDMDDYTKNAISFNPQKHTAITVPEDWKSEYKDCDLDDYYIEEEEK